MEIEETIEFSPETTVVLRNVPEWGKDIDIAKDIFRQHQLYNVGVHKAGRTGKAKLKLGNPFSGKKNQWTNLASDSAVQPRPLAIVLKSTQKPTKIGLLTQWVCDMLSQSSWLAANNIKVQKYSRNNSFSLGEGARKYRNQNPIIQETAKTGNSFINNKNNQFRNNQTSEKDADRSLQGQYNNYGESAPRQHPALEGQQTFGHNQIQAQNPIFHQMMLNVDNDNSWRTSGIHRNKILFSQDSTENADVGQQLHQVETQNTNATQNCLSENSSNQELELLMPPLQVHADLPPSAGDISPNLRDSNNACNYSQAGQDSTLDLTASPADINETTSTSEATQDSTLELAASSAEFKETASTLDSILSKFHPSSTIGPEMRNKLHVDLGRGISNASSIFLNGETIEANHYLGYGSFGVVFVTKSQTQQLTAKKLIFLDTQEKIKNIQRISDEYEKMKNKYHRNIVKSLGLQEYSYNKADVRKAFQINQSSKPRNLPEKVMDRFDVLMAKFNNVDSIRTLCLEMELCGETLRQWLEAVITGDINTDNNTRIEITQDIISGLKFLHNSKILHRDLKPSNIFFSMPAANERDRFNFPIKIGDFGQAREVEGEKSCTLTVAGTREYRAPEVDDEHYGTQADLYSLGLIIWEIFHPTPCKRTRNKFDDLKYGDDTIIEENQTVLNLKQLIIDLTRKKKSQRLKSIQDVSLQLVNDAV